MQSRILSCVLSDSRPGRTLMLFKYSYVITGYYAWFVVIYIINIAGRIPTTLKNNT